MTGAKSIQHIYSNSRVETAGGGAGHLHISQQPLEEKMRGLEEQVATIGILLY